MNETTKTTVFVGVAAAALGLLIVATWISKTRLPELELEEMVGKQLFDDFDPLSVTALDIFKFDEDTSTISNFEVAQVDERWSIPSHDDYPTDAKEQLADAASSVLGLKVLEVKGDNPGDHELYGVLDPDPKTVKAGAVGVGSRVTMKDKDEKVLLNLIVGGEVEESDGLRYVRRAGEDAIYVVKVDTGKLSTKFEDWIEDDLLKLNSWDIKQVHVSDHSVDAARGTLDTKGEMLLAYDDSGDPKWKMIEDKAFDQGQMVPVEMADDEELDTDKLNDLKSALDDLKIVDVRRKPAGLSGNLRGAEDFVQDPAARDSLQSRGFYLAQVGDKFELFSNEGDIRCLMKDGVQYVLRFGNIAGDGAPADAKKEGQGDGDSDTAGFNRYIFVMAEFSRDAIDKPVPEEPSEVEEKVSEEEGKAEGETPEGETAEGETAEGETAEGETPEGETAEGETAEGETAEGETTEEKTDQESAKEKTEDSESADAESGDAEPGDAETDEKSEAEKERERERIEKENKRKQDEYDEKIAEGEKKVKELNGRFADWYYIISDEVYQKIHLSRDQVVKKKEKKEDEGDGNGDAANDAPGGTDATDPGVGDPPEEEPAGPLEEFQNLKQEGPGGSE